MSEQITIAGNYRGWSVSLHRASYARLWFYAPGLEIYVKGEGAARQFEAIANLAMNEAAARHIPLSSLKTVPLPENRYGGQKPAAGKPVQKLLPIADDDTTGGD